MPDINVSNCNGTIHNLTVNGALSLSRMTVMYMADGGQDYVSDSSNTNRPLAVRFPGPVMTRNDTGITIRANNTEFQNTSGVTQVWCVSAYVLPLYDVGSFPFRQHLDIFKNGYQIMNGGGPTLHSQDNSSQFLSVSGTVLVDPLDFISIQLNMPAPSTTGNISDGRLCIQQI